MKQAYRRAIVPGVQTPPPLCSAIELGDQTSDTLIVMFHGYSSHPEIFADLALKCVDRLDAYVVAPVLLGHCDDVTKLYNLHFNDFLAHADGLMKRLFRKKNTWKRIVILGDCFGTYIAAHVAQKVHADALVLTSSPFILRPPLSWKPVQWIFSLFSSLPKIFKHDEKIGYLARGYGWMPGNVFTMLDHGITLLRRVIPHLHAPVLVLNLSGDPVSDESSVKEIAALSKDPRSCGVTLDAHAHIVHTSHKYRASSEYIVHWLEHTLNFEEMAGTNGHIFEFPHLEAV